MRWLRLNINTHRSQFSRSMSVARNILMYILSRALILPRSLYCVEKSLTMIILETSLPGYIPKILISTFTIQPYRYCFN